MKNIYLIGGVISFVLSFVVHCFFVQFTALGILLFVFHMTHKNSCEVAELKKIIAEHNELIKKDIEELKK